MSEETKKSPIYDLLMKHCTVLRTAEDWPSLISEIDACAEKKVRDAIRQCANIADSYAKDSYTSDTQVEAENIRNNILKLHFSPSGEEGK